MQYERIILSIILYSAIYYILLKIVLKKISNFKLVSIISIVFYLLLLILNILEYIESKDRSILNDIIIFLIFLILISINLKNNYKILSKGNSQNSKLRITYINGKKNISLIITFTFIMLFILSLFVMEFKIDNLSVILFFILSVISTVWSIIYISDLKQKSFYKESVII